MVTISSKERIKDILMLAVFAGKVKFGKDKSASSVAEKSLANYIWTLIQAGDIDDLIELANERAEKFGI